jgi:hypothetical protein
MLIDPENPSEAWTETIRAIDIDAARQECELLASQDVLTEVLSVSQLSKTKGKDGKYKFVCWLRSEVNSDDNSNDNDNNSGN